MGDKIKPNDRVIDCIGNISYECFFINYIAQNKPCLLSSAATQTWKSRIEWVTESGKPNLKYLEENFGSATVPVSNCDRKEYNSQSKMTMRMKDYLSYWASLDSNNMGDNPCLYLKDWHFCKEFPQYDAYSVPKYFASDWLNEYCKLKDDDYQFIYMGPNGTWTPLHMDVFGSYSWSANICGRKKWVLFSPGMEKYLLNDKGKLAYSIDEVCPSSDCFSSYFELIQEPGEVIFIPSGWYHQVWNIEDCISINHNWFNGSNILCIWKCISLETIQVSNEIFDCRDTDEWQALCQVVLKAHHGMNQQDFLEILRFISSSRTCCISQNWHIEYDVLQIFKTLSLMMNDPNVPEFIVNQVKNLHNELHHSNILNGSDNCSIANELTDAG